MLAVRKKYYGTINRNVGCYVQVKNFFIIKVTKEVWIGRFLVYILYVIFFPLWIFGALTLFT